MSEPWQWDTDAIRATVGAVRAGRSLAPQIWPQDTIAAVALSFDSDHETIPLRDGLTSPGQLSQGEYGARTALPRILRLLDRHEIKASFYIPAVCALLRPGEVRDYADRGHEIALHGWIHERNTALPAGAERELTLDVARYVAAQAGLARAES
jgi:peptidoglycan/xylan/chitin deacetylase (PgdA/CDA1 family)